MVLNRARERGGTRQWVNEVIIIAKSTSSSSTCCDRRDHLHPKNQLVTQMTTTTSQQVVEKPVRRIFARRETAAVVARALPSLPAFCHQSQEAKSPLALLVDRCYSINHGERTPHSPKASVSTKATTTSRRQHGRAILLFSR